MSDPSTLSERQRQLLADRLHSAAVKNAERAEDPPDPSGTGEFVALHAEHFAKASLALTQAFMTATQPRGTKK